MAPFGQLLTKEEITHDARILYIINNIRSLHADGLYEVYRVCYLELHPSEKPPPVPTKLDKAMPLIEFGVGAFLEFLRDRHTVKR
jgi:hypothetical protein